MTINLGLFVFFMLLAVGCGGVIGWFVATNHERNGLDSVRAELTRERENALLIRGHAEQLEQQNAHLQERLAQQHSTVEALAPIAQQLSSVDSYVRALENKTVQHFSTLATQLQADAKISAQLSQTAESLNTALRNSSVRGSWGEVQLRRIIEVAGMLERVDFDEQRTNSQFSESGQGTGRPDVTVHLPNGAHIAIDAKVPMASYIAAHDISETNIGAASERKELLQAHAKAVKQHVNALKKRNYPADFPQSPQITIMFLPSEALLSEALASDPQLLDYALADGIILTSPASLLALLRSVAAIWRSAQASEQARDIVNAGRELVDRLAVFVRHITKLGSHLSSSVTSYNKAMASLESRVLVTYRSFDALGENLSDLETHSSIIDPEKANVRKLSAPELTSAISDENTDE
ncbi:DNA recombination protein RmuC [Arcanobacterium buesumense]|uniref:DNA recombination protein RmuC n=1 Tax=Arcanobacterium buesumense TaxID=2722751 RepID=A0A6H2EMU6_9ACTO|nr:DNA recombination protein RmuC [Arcanobacterium buesumense]QJC22391.1 DNA recombination protein RmuC [Arcanobacterium buesumense]